jgi:hypothetical protein
MQAAGNERQRLRGDPINPLGIVDGTDQRLGLGYRGEQAQHRQSDQKPVRRISGTQPEGGGQRVALGLR